jgi:hypothetical protein
MSKINIYVNSKNRKSDETPSNFSVIIPDGLLKVDKDEYFTMSVNSFYCYNDFYQCNNNCNSFNIILKNNVGNISGQQLFLLPVGNLNVNDIVNAINSVLQPANVLSCTYDNIKNKITFTRLTPQTPTNNTFYINTLKVGNFLGFKNDTDILISFNGTSSTYPININTITALSVGIDGDISFNHNNMESNLNNSVYKASDLIFQTAVNVPKGYLITYQNIDGGDSFKYTLGNNDRIKYFILSVYDQDGNTISDMTDYIIHIQFTINKKSQQEQLLKTLIALSRLSGTVRWLWNSRPGNAGLAAQDPAPSRARRR